MATLLGRILAILRLLAFAGVAVAATVVLMTGRLFRSGHKFNYAVFTASLKSIRVLLNIKVKYYGKPPEHQGVIMSNHRSYIDGVLIPSRIPYVVVAKVQVRSWPVVGQACRALKIIFVDRDSVASRRATRESIRHRLEEGISVLIFPEGTTAAGPEILPFKQGMFNTCAEGAFNVIPCAIEYYDQDMAWIGSDTFLPHFMRAFSHRAVKVAVSFGEPISGDDGSDLRLKTESWVAAETMRMRKLWDRKSY